MEGSRPGVFVINISPENWEYCIEDHRFGIRVGVHHPKFDKGDIFLVRKTGKEYGVMGIWLFSKEQYVNNPTEVPWDDSEYKWQQWFEPLVDFRRPMSEEFTGTSKYSSKIEISAMRLAGSVKSLNGPEIVRYLQAILNDKADELLSTVDHEGKRKSIKDVLTEMLTLYQVEKVTTISTVTKEDRDSPVGEPINFRGMIYAPLNEAGVVLLFSKVMDDLGVVYESSPLTGFDMVGRERTDRGYVRKHFEFEYRSSNFKTHGHDPSMVDYLVCWEHDWNGCPDDLQVIELKQVIRDFPAEF